MFFVCKGVAASLQTTRDGDTQIARFFERGQVCSNITSAWQKTVSEDELIALTDFAGLRIPFETFRSAFMHGGLLDTFWREAIIETLLFDKEILCTKTIRDVGARYRFMATRYATVIEQVPDRDLARFLGITPQGLSRCLRNNRGELTQANVVNAPCVVLLWLLCKAKEMCMADAFQMPSERDFGWTLKTG